MEELAAGILAGDRRSLARGITLVESTRADHRAHAIELLESLLPHTGGSTRVGISGSPGVGKSTFIEAFGMHVADEGKRIAVLAVDPSSRRSGGSILGDKTRMVDLVRHPNSFIRPSPAGATLGGVARRTGEALLLCEAAGFDVVVVETVGVGQSETAVSDLVDLFLLLVAPGGGDDLQGIKRGIMELADLVVVNKADGDMADAARRTVADYRSALGLMRPRWNGVAPEVLSTSAINGEGIEQVAETIKRLAAEASSAGELERHRSRQAVAWMWDEVREELVGRLLTDARLAQVVHQAEHDVAQRATSPSAAAHRILTAG